MESGEKYNACSTPISPPMDFLITVTILFPSVTPIKAEVHRFDSIGSLSQIIPNIDPKERIFFSFNGQILQPAMSFNFYNITDGSSIVVSKFSIEQGNSNTKKKHNHIIRAYYNANDSIPSNLEVDQSRPLKIAFDPRMNSNQKQASFLRLANMLMPQRAQQLSLIADRRTMFFEEGLIFRRHISGSSVKEPEDQKPLSNSVVIPAKEPGESALPNCWNDEPQSAEIAKCFVTIPFISK